MDIKKRLLLFSLMSLLSMSSFANTEEGEAAYKQQHYEKAFLLLSDEAAKGDAKAQYLLGKMYYEGQGIAFNAEKAEQLLLSAANQGNIDAQVLLAGLHWHQNTQEGFKKSLHWYQKAADQNNS